MAEVIAVLKKKGAVVVDPADIPSVVARDPKRNFLQWPVCSGLDNARGNDAGCSIVFKYGMKRDFNGWLASLGPAAPVKTLTELRLWNVGHQKAGAIKYGQANLDISDEMELEADRIRYKADRARDLRLAGSEGLDAVMKQHKLDALLFPGGSGAAIAAKPGYPTVMVPFGLLKNAATPPFPEGWSAKPAPFGVSFTGLACSEPRLLDAGLRLRAGDPPPRAAALDALMPGPDRRCKIGGSPQLNPRESPRWLCTIAPHDSEQNETVAGDGDFPDDPARLQGGPGDDG